MSNTDKKDALLLKASKVLIKDGEAPIARSILKTLDHPQATEWLDKLGKSKAAQSSRFLMGGLLAGVLICLMIGFSMGRVSVSSAPQNDGSEIFNFSQSDYQTATAIVEHSLATSTARHATSAVWSTYAAQSETAIIQTVTQMYGETQEAQATWRVERTATQAVQQATRAARETSLAETSVARDS